MAVEPGATCREFIVAGSKIHLNDLWQASASHAKVVNMRCGHRR